MNERHGHVLIDLTQFVAEPYATGVQRVLHGLLSSWRHDLQPAVVGYRRGNRLHIVSTEAAARMLDLVFDPPDLDDWERTEVRSEAVYAGLSPHVQTVVPPSSSPWLFGSYLLPEPSYRPETLDTLARWSAAKPARTMAIVCDALPQIEPWAFAAPDQSHTSRYFRLVSSLQHVSSISDQTREQILRMARRPVPGAVVHLPGADTFGRRHSPSPAIPTIVAPGTIEPRKRIDRVLDAVELLWDRGHPLQLVCIGRAGWADPGPRCQGRAPGRPRGPLPVVAVGVRRCRRR